MTPLATALTDTLHALRTESWISRGLVDEYSQFLIDDAQRVYRHGPQHFTASAVLFTPDLDKTLLCYHRKGQMWVQLGGHMETSDDTPAAGALREATEESGLGQLSLLHRLPIDLNRHTLAASFGECRAHWDVVYALSTPYAPPKISAESIDVQWFDVDELPDACAPGFVEQFATILYRLRTQR